ncbi:sigma-70 family RNA polymerase sigma factor [Virgibacillus byunsanensis]|uniref:Sigma-70 family RNA polymerase sigma factor n=1 Tax=Virgibacillus byunsanensis TaxID=570945 RepID=A0ABW3LN67_9BACI
MEKKSISFEELFKQNERRIFYQIHKLRGKDPDRELYQEGLLTMWNAYETYTPDKGLLATYFNYTIRHRLVDLLRKKASELRNEQVFIHDRMLEIDNGNRVYINNKSYPIFDYSDSTIIDPYIWRQVKSLLTINQWKWVYYFVIQDLPVKEIAKLEDTTADAVKSWGKEVRKKLRNEKFLQLLKE